MFRRYIRLNCAKTFKMIALSQLLQNMTSVVTVTWISTLLAGRVFDFHTNYHLLLDKQDKEKWLMTQCQDDSFYHSLAYHSDLCEQVSANAKISPILFGINESLGQMKLCGFYHCADLFKLIVSGGTPVIVCIVLLYILTPSFLIPVAQRSYEAWRTESFNRKCSPYKKDDDYDMRNRYPLSDPIFQAPVKYV